MTIATIEDQADRAAAMRDFSHAAALLEMVTTREPDRLAPWLKLGAMRRALGELPGSFVAVERALAVDPLDLTALLMRATILDALGEHDRAGEGYGRALAQVPGAAPPSLAPVIAAARTHYLRWQQRRVATLRSRVDALTPALDRFITNIVHQTEPDRPGPTHYAYPDLTCHAFWPRVQFPWLERIEAEVDAIRDEFEAVMAHRAAELVPYVRYPIGVPLGHWATLNDSRDWTAIHLLDRGQVTANAAHCPRTLALLSDLPQPDMAGAGPNAMFSLLAPGTHIPPHTGVANTRLVCHLPLVVPPDCWFRVGTQHRTWHEGKAFVFDDTVEHEAMNASDRLRVILIFDIWHPDLTASDRNAVRALVVGGDALHRL